MAVGRGVLRVSAISLREVALLASHGRIVLGKPANLWLDEALVEPGLAIEPLTRGSRSKAVSCRRHFIRTRPTV